MITRKKVYIFLFFVVLIVSVVQIANITIFQLPKERAERCFQKDKNELVDISNYLISLKEQYVYIYNDDGFMQTDYPQKIDNENVKFSIKKLLNRGYVSINKVGNLVIFLRWTYSSDYGAGFLFSRTEEKIALPYLTKNEVLSEKGWYYYEENYNEWREYY